MSSIFDERGAIVDYNYQYYNALPEADAAFLARREIERLQDRIIQINKVIQSLYAYLPEFKEED